MTSSKGLKVESCLIAGAQVDSLINDINAALGTPNLPTTESQLLSSILALLENIKNALAQGRRLSVDCSVEGPKWETIVSNLQAISSLLIEAPTSLDVISSLQKFIDQQLPTTELYYTQLQLFCPETTIPSATESSDSAPESSDSAPESTDSAQESTDSAPESTDFAPESSDSSQESTDSAQESTDSAPQSTDSAPQSTDSASESTDSAPESTDSAPESTHSAQESTDSAPESTDSAPEGTDSFPENTDSAPESTDSAPESTDSAQDGGEKRALRNAVEGDTVAGLTNIMTVLGEVLESLVTVSNSTDKVAAVFAVDFFHNALEFFYSLSSLDIGDSVESVEFSGILLKSAEKLISDSKAGVTLPSGEFKLVYHTIGQSINITIELLKLKIDFLLCGAGDPTQVKNIT